MRLYERSNSPFLWYDFEVNGKRYRGSTGYLPKEHRKAQKHLADLYVTKRDNKSEGKPTITLEEALGRALRGVSDSTAKTYTASFKRICGLSESHGGRLAKSRLANPLARDLCLHELTTDMVEELKESLEDCDYSPYTINADLSLVSKMITSCKSRYAVPLDLDISFVSVSGKFRYLSQDEMQGVEALLSQSHREAAVKSLGLFYILSDTGVRKSEATSSQWRNFDFESNLFEVYRPKTKSVSIVPLTPRVAHWLRRHHNQPQPFFEMGNAIVILRDAINKICNTDPVVIETRGRATIHTLRDTFASRLLQKGMSLYELSKLLGHSSIKMTQKYAQLENRDVALKARELLL